MNLFDSLSVAIKGLTANKGRSVLTILGVIIGVAAVITMMSVGKGAQSLIINQLSSLGSNNIFVEPGPWSKRMERGSMMRSMTETMDIKTLKYEDALAIAKLPTVARVAPFTMGVIRMVYKNNSKKVTFFGTTPQAPKTANVRCILGRNLMDHDIKSMAKVVVLGYKTSSDLFGEENPIGKAIRIKKTNFRVIGVLEEVGPQAFMSLDEGLYIPITTSQKLLLGEKHIRFIMIKSKSAPVIDETVENIRLLLRERHHIHNPQGDPAKDDFKVMSQKETTKILGNIMDIFTILLVSIAAISLVVGGIGIMNIMLVSVTERTREIGLRKAVGAREKDILTQFLLESILLTLCGGILGIILGALLSYGVSLAFGYFLGNRWGFLLPLDAVAWGVGVSVAIGLAFGIYPARKASKLNPIDALRYE